MQAATPRRLVYCLPTRVLVEQTHRNILEWLERAELLAPAPGASGRVLPVLLMGGEAPEHEWWLYPEQPMIRVGTQEMLLSRALGRGYGSSRYRWPQEFGLLNNHVLWVMDEVQLMGSGLSTTAQLAAFRQQLGVYGPAASLWVSATQEARWLDTADHPAPTRVLSLSDKDYEQLGPRYWAEKLLTRAAETTRQAPELARAILSHHAPGTDSLAICNTVDRAQDLYAALERALGQVPEQERPGLYLLHGRFRPHERANWPDLLSAAPTGPGRIFVSTQTIEAGVDLDARILWTEIAPWPSLVQRFGRCNRTGRQEGARIYWLEVERPHPYTEAELAEARTRLEQLEGQFAAPAALAAIALPEGRPVGYPLRRRDILQLFDTSPDLLGNDLDVSQYIRELDERDLYIYWREWEGQVPPGDLKSPRPEELCPVPIEAFRSFLGANIQAWRYDHLFGQWRTVAPADLCPGQTLLLAARSGGYHPALGWTGRGADQPVPVVPITPAGRERTAADEALGADAETDAGGWMPLPAHADATVELMERLLQHLLELAGRQAEAPALLAAGRWHDAGKGHSVFQETLRQAAAAEGESLDPEQIWAKSPYRPGRHRRRHFRHELVSALLYLQHQGWADKPLVNLTAYLIAAHHGKVRLAIRSYPDEEPPAQPGLRHALGVHEGESLPQPVDLGAGIRIPAGTPLALELMEWGLDGDGHPSWLQRILGLRDHPEWGPFRLAYLEGILRAADARASMQATGRTPAQEV